MGYREEVQVREIEDRLLGSGVGEQRNVSNSGRKRLVSKHRYILTMLGKGGLYSSALLFFGAGVVLLLLDALILIVAAYLGLLSFVNLEAASILVFIAVLGAIGIWAGVGLIKKVKAIEPVAPITRHNTGLLPERETLVRGADIPPSHPQAELLRAAQGDKETSPTELLRASTTNFQSDQN